MTIAPSPLPTPTAVADTTGLLPGREAVLARLADELPTTGEKPGTLIVLGLLRRDDGLPVPRPLLAEITSLLARSLRGDDWLASSGPTEFVIVMAGPALGARAAADRLSAAIADLGIPGLSAAAGLATLTPALSAGEALRRATVSLTAARRVGPGTVVQHRLPY